MALTQLLPMGTEGVAFTAALAAFTDANPNAPVTDFTATISWGDNQTSPGTITGSNTQGFTVAGTHTYLQEGSYNASVQISDVGGSTLMASRMITIADAPVVIT